MAVFDRGQALQQTRRAVLDNAPPELRERLAETSAELQASSNGAGPEHAARQAMT
jgi:hypothetical protein